MYNDPWSNYKEDIIDFDESNIYCPWDDNRTTLRQRIRRLKWKITRKYFPHRIPDPF